MILDIASGWELDNALDRENVEKLTQNYIGSARAIINKYIGKFTSARLGN